MENSMKSQTEETCSEESSWSFYIQDFVYGNDDDNNNINDDFVRASLPSGAASSASKTPNNYYYYQNNKANSIISSSKSKCNDIEKAMKMSLTKRRVVQEVIDEDLQDTASSPVNTPNKIPYKNEFLMKQKDVVGSTPRR